MKNVSWNDTLINTTYTGFNTTCCGYGDLSVYHLSRQPWFINLGTTFHCVGCLVSLTIAYVAIFKHYYQSKSMLKQLKYTSILCILVWTVSNLSWLATYILYPRYNEKVSFARYAASHVSEAIATHLTSLGYYLFILSFAMRVFYSFKDSLFETSKQQQKSTIIAAVLGIIILFISFVLKILALTMDHIKQINTIFNLESVHVWLLSTGLLAIGMILYLITSLMLLKVMITKMYDFAEFISGDMNSTKKIQIRMSSPTTDLANTPESTNHDRNHDLVMSHGLDHRVAALSRLSAVTDHQNDADTHLSLRNNLNDDTDNYNGLGNNITDKDNAKKETLTTQPHDPHQTSQIIRKKDDVVTVRENGTQCTNETKIKIKMMKLIQRLVVLYSIALLSSVVIFTIIIFAMSALIEYGNYTKGGTFYIVFRAYYRLLVMIDSIINCICLLLQNETAVDLYDKYCCCCKASITKCCLQACDLCA